MRTHDEAARAADTVELTVRKITPQPGDVLVFTVRDGVGNGRFQDILEGLRPAIPPGCSAILLTGGITVEQLRADDIVPAGVSGFFRVAR